MSRSRPLRARLALAVGAAAAGLVLTATPAFAHVDATGTAGTDGATEVTFTFEHGCGTSPTTSLRVQLPAGTTGVTAENPTGFTSTVSDTEIAWSGGSIATDADGAFTATMTLTGNVGDVVYFPTIQGCATGEEAWIDKTPDAEGEHAAPRITLAAAGTPTTEPADHDAESTTTAAPATTTTAKATTTAAPTTTAAVTTTAKAASTTTTATPASSNTSSSSNVGLIVAAIIVALLVVGGVFAALQRRSRTNTP